MDQNSTSRQPDQQAQTERIASQSELAAEAAAVMQTLPERSRTLYQGFLMGLQAATETKKAG